MSSQTNTPTTNGSSRLRASYSTEVVMTKESPKRSTLASTPKPKPKPKPKPATTPSNEDISTKPRKPKSGGLIVPRPVHRPVVKQLANRPRRQKKTEDDPDSYGNNNKNNNNNNKKDVVISLDDEINKELNVSRIQDLEAEVVRLKAELDKALAFNQQLQLQNHKLSQELAASHANIAPTLSSTQHQRESIGDLQSPKFKGIQRLIANKLERSGVKKEAIIEASVARTPSPSLPPPPPTPSISQSSKFIATEKKPSMPSSSLPPLPPLPPPPPPPSARAPTIRKPPAFLEFYHSITEQQGKTDSSKGLGNQHKQATISAHNSIVGEIQNRSAHLLAIRADIETKGEFINSLISKVQAAAYADIEDVLKFVDWLDGELATLADERAVLKHFNWPERKADSLREAAVEYHELKLLESEISSYKNIDTGIPCAAALKKMASLLDKSEKSVQKLIKLRNSVLRSYQELKIPTDWMLDSGIVTRIKKASMNLVKMFMKRVRSELESIQNSDRESLLLQGVHFAYRAHQFAGGLDSETLCAFEEIRQRLPRHLRGSTEELLPAIPSS